MASAVFINNRAADEIEAEKWRLFVADTCKQKEPRVIKHWTWDYLKNVKVASHA